MKAVVAALLLATLLAGCGSSPRKQETARSSERELLRAQPPDQPLFRADRDQVVMTAFAQVGKPYRYGGNGPDDFDCSGLVRYAYAAGGAKTPRTTATLFASGEAIPIDKAQPGDLLFYRLDPERRAPSHVVFYLGDGEGIHAPSSGGSIRIVRTGIPYFTQRYVGARRLID